MSEILQPLELSHNGVRAHVTVLFVDIVNSSNIVTYLDPEESDEVFQNALSIFLNAIQASGGIVNQSLGDGAMGLFGINQERSDHALRAFLAAHQIINGMEATEATIKRKYGVKLHVRIGLNSGETVLHAQKETFHGQYRIVGQTVHLADRIQKCAGTNEICVSEMTKDLIGAFGSFSLKKTLSLTEEGADTNVYRAVINNSNLAVIKNDKVPDNYVNRPHIEKTVFRMLEGIRIGAGQALEISGEAGIGKSSLVGFFLARANMLEAQIFSWDFLPTYIPRTINIAQYILSNLLHIKSESDLSHAMIQGVAASIGVDIDVVRSALKILLLGEDAGKHLAQLMQERKTEIIHNVITNLIVEAFKDAPLILALEDLQYANANDQKLVTHLATKISASKIFLIMTTRSSEGIHLPRENIKKIKLKGLTRKQAYNFFNQIFEQENQFQDLKNHIFKIAKGNPFYMKEFALIVESGNSKTNIGLSSAASLDLKALDLPYTIEGIFSSRYNALGDDEKKVISIASVIGLRFSLDLLSEILEISTQICAEHLKKLEQLKFIKRVQIFPNIEFEFEHDLLQNSIYKHLLLKRRTEIHRKIFALLRRNDYSQFYEWPLAAMHHSYHAKLWSFCYAVGRNYAQLYMDKGDYNSALMMVSCALEALEKYRHLAGYKEKKLKLYLTLLNISHISKNYRRVKDIIKLINEDIKNFKDPHLAKIYYHLLMKTNWCDGNLIEAEKDAERFIELARQSNDFENEILAISRLAGVQSDRGDFRNSIINDGLIVAKVPAEDYQKKYGLLTAALPASHATLAVGHAYLGKFLLAHEHFSKTLEMCNQDLDPFSRIYSLTIGSQGHLLQRNPAPVREHLMRAYETCKQVGGTLLYSVVLSSMATDALLEGKIKQAKKAVDEAYFYHYENEFDLFHMYVEIPYIRTYLALGDEEAVLGNLTRFRNRAENSQELHTLSWLNLLEGMAIFKFGKFSDWGRALAAIESSVALARVMGSPVIEANCYHELTQIYKTKNSQLLPEYEQHLNKINKNMGIKFNNSP